MKLFLENVRSLAGRHQLELTPLTLLVGENSSGKTTCLAALSAIFSSTGFPFRPAFNEPPFDLGGYDTIATYRGGRYGRAKHFSLGYASPAAEDREATEVIGVFRNASGQPALHSLSMKSSAVSVQLTLETNRITGKVLFSATGEHQAASFDIDQELPDAALAAHSFSYVMYETLFRSDPGIPRRHAAALFALIDRSPATRTIAVAPVRTKPRRTYDPITDEFQPEGDHIPLVLARVLSTTAPSRNREEVQSALVDFGKSSGLFTELKIRRLGPSPSDPFQILVAADARPFNLTDVGYGVSQALPVVVESTRGGRGQLMLLQQPEVHLHPRAQASLGSFFAKLAGKEAKQFVIETHSDYLVDRVRQEVAAGTLPSALVSILFFERRHGETYVHRLAVDDDGNIINAPPSYRAFFLQEEQALLRRTQPQLFE